MQQQARMFAGSCWLSRCRVSLASQNHADYFLASARLYVKRCPILFAQTVSSAAWNAVAAGRTLVRMGRHKTISDDQVLQVARGLFREKGHTATTREIAEAAGISEAILY